MASKETTVSFSLAILAAFLLLSTVSAATIISSRVSHASPFCEDATNSILCTIMAKGADNWPEAMTNTIAFAIKRAKTGKAIAYGVAGKLPDDLLPEAKKSIDSTCKEAYDALISNLEQCMGFVKDDSASALKYRLSSLTFFDCKNALEEFGVSLPQVNKYDDMLAGMSSTILEVLQKNPEYV